MSQFDEVQTKVSVGQEWRGRPGNLTLENARFFKRPNFSGEMDEYKNDDRVFNVIIPNEVSEDLRKLGWNVKTLLPRNEEETGLSFLKVKVDFNFDKDHPGDVEYERGPDVWIIMGEEREKLTSKTIGILDRARLESLDMEIRGWEYNPDEAPGALSARLVQLVAIIRPSLLDQKYGGLR